MASNGDIGTDIGEAIAKGIKNTTESGVFSSVVSILIGLYIVMVLWGGKESHLLELIKSEVGFIKWGVAVLTLSYLYTSVPNAGVAKFIKSFALLATLALVLQNGEKMFNQIEEVFK